MLLPRITIQIRQESQAVSIHTAAEARDSCNITLLYMLLGKFSVSLVTFSSPITVQPTLCSAVTTKLCLFELHTGVL